MLISFGVRSISLVRPKLQYNNVESSAMPQKLCRLHQHILVLTIGAGRYSKNKKLNVYGAYIYGENCQTLGVQGR